MSPSHQVRQTDGTSCQATASPIRRLETPIVALTIVLTPGGQPDEGEHIPNPP